MPATSTTSPTSRLEHLDVLIVGAGLSGVGAAYHLQTKCPKKRYAIVESRERLGGTWDYFRYPGIRSDSDMYTLGYSFRPWTNAKAIADGASILAYIRDTAEAHGIDRKIRYQQRVEAAHWSSKDSRWTVDLRDGASGELRKLTCSFLFMCSGYYDYDEGYTPDFPGKDRFEGQLVHPQKWTPDVTYEGKRVVVIGSGATAVTLVPELAKRAAHVTMLQRSPTYVISAPEKDVVADFMRGKIPAESAYAITRWKNVLLASGFYAYCRAFPKNAKSLLVRQAKRQLRGAVDVAHFTPTYDPWDQRLCLVPDGDLFKTLRAKRASIVTGVIETFTETGIKLTTGEELAADLVVSATGLKLKLFGGLKLHVDGKAINPAETLTYKGVMLSDVPNFAMAIGYTNASWTLKCDLTSEYVCRLLNHMDVHGYTQLCARRNDPKVEEAPLLTFTSGYVQRSLDKLPRQGSFAPWKLYQNYALDRMMLRHAPLEDKAMEFKSTPR